MFARLAIAPDDDPRLRAAHRCGTSQVAEKPPRRCWELDLANLYVGGVITTRCAFARDNPTYIRPWKSG